MKPTKRGIKVWIMADAVTGYCCNLQVYTGKEGNDVDKGLASRVVKDIMEDYQGQGHQLFLLTTFTSLLSFSRIF